MRYKIFIALVIAVLSIPFTLANSYAGGLDQGYAMERAGGLEGAADYFCGYANSNPSDKNTPEALLRCARLLDTIQDSLTEKAEKKCYWAKGASRTPDCMKREADAQNARFGPGSFSYLHAITYIPYSGAQYRTLLSKFPKSKYAMEADFYLMLRGLVGHPDMVLSKIRAFLKRHPSGNWNRKGRLLWARVNEDVWYVHKKWSWVLYNYKVSPEDLIVKAEPYRQEALRTYEKLMKDRGAFEGQAALREYADLKNNRYGSRTYSIVNDSNSGTLSEWGIDAPRIIRAPMTPSTSLKPALPPADGIARPEAKQTRTPRRWN